MRMIRLILTIVFSALAFVSMGANDCTDVVLHEWDTDEPRMPKLIKDETGREEYDGTEKPENLVTWVYDGTSFTPVAKVTEDERYTIVHDYLGTPTEAYDTEGNEVWSRVLDMDGNVIEETGNVGMVPFLFQGQYYDRETGLANNRFRYYDPKTDAYISQDPIGLAGGILNLYGYVDDTNKFIDINGLDWNYVLIDSNNDVYYAGRASDSSSMMDVANRHAGTSGTDGTRFGSGDKLVRIMPSGTPYGAVRGIEQFGIDNSSVSLLGYGSSAVRGNKISGISKHNKNREVYLRAGSKERQGLTLADLIKKGSELTFEEYQKRKKNSY